MTDEIDEVRCPECGARNTPQADWCTQCFTALGAPEEPAATDESTGDAATTSRPPPPPPSDDSMAAAPDGLLPPPPPETATPGDDATATGDGPRQLRSGGGRFRETDEGLEWVCGVCQEWNPIERISCSVCSTPFGRTLGSEEPPERPDVPPAVLATASLLLPGAGHWMLRMRGAGLLRAVLGVVWGLGGLTLFLQARSSGQSFLPAIPLLLGWAIVAAGAANDAVVEAGGSGDKVLKGRVLLWLTLAVVGGTFAAAMVGVMSAVGQ